MKLITIIFVTLFPLSFFLSLIYGDVEIPISQLLHPNSIYAYILYEIRLPTILSAIFIGIILSVSGAILQMLLRNPLVDSYISGTASGGAFGAVLTYFLLLFNLPFSWIVFFQPIIAFLMALLATLITIIIGKRSGFLGLIIGGVLVSFVFSSLVTVLLSFMSSKYPQIPPLTFWLLGDISVIGWFDVIILAILSTLLLSLAILKSRIIDLLAISDEISYAHGLNPNNQRILWLALVSFAVAYCVSIAGTIGFLGLIVPHIVRRLIGGNTKVLSIYSSLIGSTILMLSNIISRGLLGYYIPLTAIMSLIGSPIMITALVRRNAGAEEH